MSDGEEYKDERVEEWRNNVKEMEKPVPQYTSESVDPIRGQSRAQAWEQFSYKQSHPRGTHGRSDATLSSRYPQPEYESAGSSYAPSASSYTVRDDQESIYDLGEEVRSTPEDRSEWYDDRDNSSANYNRDHGDFRRPTGASTAHTRYGSHSQQEHHRATGPSEPYPGFGYGVRYGNAQDYTSPRAQESPHIPTVSSTPHRKLPHRQYKLVLHPVYGLRCYRLSIIPTKETLYDAAVAEGEEAKLQQNDESDEGFRLRLRNYQDLLRKRQEAERRGEGRYRSGHGKGTKKEKKHSKNDRKRSGRSSATTPHQHQHHPQPSGSNVPANSPPLSSAEYAEAARLYGEGATRLVHPDDLGPYISDD